MKKLFSIRNWRVFVLLGTGLLVGCFFYNPFEPHYQGKSLSAWAAIPPVNTFGAVLSENEQRQRVLAAKAIRNIGPKALPYAIKLCRAQDSPLINQLMEIADDDGKLFGFQLTTAGMARSRSWRIFHVLGPAARPAIPALIQLMQETNREIAAIASSDLICIGPDAIPPMIELLTNRNVLLRVGAAVTLTGLERDYKTQTRPALPILLQCLNDEDVSVRVRAAYALGGFGEDAPEVIPALIAVVKSETNTYALTSIIRALGSFGTNAQAAIPFLIENIKSDQSGRARFELNALRRISPQTADVYYQKLNMAQTNPPPDDLVSNLYYNYFGKEVPFGSQVRMSGRRQGPMY